MIIVQRWQRSCCSSGRKSDKAVAFQWITTTIILQQRVYSLTKWWPCFRKLPRHCFHMQCMPLPRIAKDCPGLPRIGFLIQKQVFSHSCMIALQYGVTIINVYVADWTKSSAIKHFPLEPNIPHLFTLSRHLSLVEPSCKKSPRQEKTKQQNACLYHFPSYIRAISTFNLKWIDRNGKYLLYCKIHEIQHLITNDAVVVGELFGLFAKNHVMFNWIEAAAPVVLLDN